MSRSFTEIARLYQRARAVSKRDGRSLKLICETTVDELGMVGAARADKIRGRHVADIAKALYPTVANASKNRLVVVPMNAVLRWAAREELIPAAPIIDRFKEAKILPRRPAPDVMETLIDNTTGAKQVFLVLLRCQGWRLSELLGLRWNHVDLETQSFRVWVGKARTEKIIAMHPDVEAMFRIYKRKSATGRVFPWDTNDQVYSWLKPLCSQLGVTFTPHMGRHEFASKLNEVAGATPSDLVRLGTWTTTSSIDRYIHPSDEHTRSMLAKL